jgi:hypothetical protein
MTESKALAKSAFILPVAVTALMVAVIAVVFLNIPSKPKTPVEAFIAACGGGAERTECASVESIRQAFGFDLPEEIKAVHTKMKKTAQDIAQGRLSDEAYKTCLQSGECAPVPMLGKHDNPESPEGKVVSRIFWQLADGKRLSPEACETIPICAAGLKSGSVEFLKNKIVPRVKKS